MEADVLRVLQMANGYLGNRLYENLFAALAEKDVENLVYVPVNIADRTASPEGVTVSHCFSTLDRALYFRKQKKMIRDMEGIYQIPSVDVIHAHTLFSAGYTALQFQKKYGIPYIVAVRNTDVNVFFKYMVHLRKVGVEILRHAEKVIFLSPVYQQKVLEKYVPRSCREEIAEKCLVIPNGIAPLFFANQAQAPRRLESGPLRLIYVGEISSNKNLELTIQAVKLLNDRGITAVLKAVGTIKEEKYQNLIAGSPFVQHCERCPQEEVLQHLRGSDIFVMPSHKETFGLVYAEAMSQGLPVLYTKGEGFDGQFPEGTVGYAVSDTDAEALAGKILAVKDNYERMSQNCISLVNQFNWSGIAARYAQIYETCAEKSR